MSSARIRLTVEVRLGDDPVGSPVTAAQVLVPDQPGVDGPVTVHEHPAPLRPLLVLTRVLLSRSATVHRVHVIHSPLGLQQYAECS